MGDTYESVGPRRSLDGFLAEYGLREEHVRDRIKVHTHEPLVQGGTPEEEYLVHESLLRSHGEFPCARPGPSGRVPRIWIVGLGLAYHQTPDDWAGDIYYGKDSHW